MHSALTKTSGTCYGIASHRMSIAGHASAQYRKSVSVCNQQSAVLPKRCCQSALFTAGMIRTVWPAVAVVPVKRTVLYVPPRWILQLPRVAGLVKQMGQTSMSSGVGALSPGWRQGHAADCKKTPNFKRALAHFVFLAYLDLAINKSTKKLLTKATGADKPRPIKRGARAGHPA